MLISQTGAILHQAYTESVMIQQCEKKPLTCLLYVVIKSENDWLNMNLRRTIYLSSCMSSAILGIYLY